MTSEILKLKNNSSYIEDKVACVRQFNMRTGQWCMASAQTLRRSLSKV